MLDGALSLVALGTVRPVTGPLEVVDIETSGLHVWVALRSSGSIVTRDGLVTTSSALGLAHFPLPAVD